MTTVFCIKIVAFCNKTVAFFNKTVAFFNKTVAFCNKLLSHFVIISGAFGNKCHNELNMKPRV